MTTAVILQCFVLVSTYADDRPNILLLMAEDMSPRVGALGDSVAITPNIDQLAAKGVSFTNSFTTAGVCAPSRAAIIMGMHQESFGAQHMRAYVGGPTKYQTVPPVGHLAFPELLRAAGYYTFATTKLDYQFSGPAAGSGPFSVWDRNDRFGGYATPPSTPFFGYVTYMETHESGLFSRWTWPTSMAHFMAQLMHIRFHWQTEDQISGQDVKVPPYYPDTAIIREDIARHYNNIITMDRKVGDILKQLEADGVADNTIVIWTTDHGDGFPRAKRELYDSGLHVPLIVYWPEKYRPKTATPGSTDDSLVSLVDLAPTLLTLAGVEVPQHMQGTDFLDNDNKSKRQYVFAARDRIGPVPDKQRAVRDDRFKYIYSHSTAPGGFPLAYRDTTLMMKELWRKHDDGTLNEVQMQWFSKRPVEMLFDTENDPHEVTNLADDPAYEDVLVRLRTALANHESSIRNNSLEEAERKMASDFWPNETQPNTAAPQLARDKEGRFILFSDTKGASIDYRIDAEPWRLYTGPITLSPENTLEAKAVRYGWAASETVTLDVSQNN